MCLLPATAATAAHLRRWSPLFLTRRVHVEPRRVVALSSTCTSKRIAVETQISMHLYIYICIYNIIYIICKYLYIYIDIHTLAMHPLYKPVKSDPAFFWRHASPQPFLLEHHLRTWQLSRDWLSVSNVRRNAGRGNAEVLGEERCNTRYIIICL